MSYYFLLRVCYFTKECVLLYICRIFSEDHVTTVVQVCVFIEVGVARLLDVLLYFTELGVTLY